MRTILSCLACLLICGCSGVSNQNNKNSVDSNKLTNSSNPVNLINDSNKQHSSIDTVLFSVDYDLDDDGQKDSVIFYRYDSSFYLKINQETPLNLHTQYINDIYNEHGIQVPMAFLRCGSKTNLVIGIPDSTFIDQTLLSEQTLLYVYTFENPQYKPIDFYDDTLHYHYLVLKEGLALIDTKQSKIYAYVTDNINGIGLQIDRYGWDSTKEQLYFEKSKIFDGLNSIFLKPKKIIF